MKLRRQLKVHEADWRHSNGLAWRVCSTSSLRSKYVERCAVVLLRAALSRSLVPMSLHLRLRTWHIVVVAMFTPSTHSGNPSKHWFLSFHMLYMFFGSVAVSARSGAAQ